MDNINLNGVCSKTIFGLNPIIIILIFCMLITFPISGRTQTTVVDLDGNQYSTVCFGSQIWMAQNLRTKHKLNGETIESFNYLNDTANEPKYGRLYSWNAAMDGSSKESSQGICPSGWHLPSDDEWNILIDFLGGQDQAGKALRIYSSTSFLQYLGGNYYPDIKAFSYIDQQTYFWTSSMFNGSVAWIRNIGLKNSNINRSTVNKKFCFSIRCLKN